MQGRAREKGAQGVCVQIFYNSKFKQKLFQRLIRKQTVLKLMVVVLLPTMNAVAPRRVGCHVDWAAAKVIRDEHVSPKQHWRQGNLRNP